MLPATRRRPVSKCGFTKTATRFASASATMERGLMPPKKPRDAEAARPGCGRGAAGTAGNWESWAPKKAAATEPGFPWPLGRMRKKGRSVRGEYRAVVRQGFRMILGAQADMEIVGEAGNGREAVT